MGVVDCKIYSFICFLFGAILSQCSCFATLLLHHALSKIVSAIGISQLSRIVFDWYTGRPS